MNGYLVSIDPGIGGGIVTWDKQGMPKAYSMKSVAASPESLFEFLDNEVIICEDDIVYIERQPKFCGWQQFEETPIPSSSMAVQYGNYMLCYGICLALGARVVPIAPVKWQNLVECRNIERLKKLQWKNKLKRKAIELYGSCLKITLWNADALLIGHAAKILENSA